MAPQNRHRYPNDFTHNKFGGGGYFIDLRDIRNGHPFSIAIRQSTIVSERLNPRHSYREIDMSLTPWPAKSIRDDNRYVYSRCLQKIASNVTG